MNAAYAARYRDHLGEEHTTIFNDGETLTMTVRGVKFQGHDANAMDTVRETVQETFLCSEFEKHPPETGYSWRP